MLLVILIILLYYTYCSYSESYIDFDKIDKNNYKKGNWVCYDNKTIRRLGNDIQCASYDGINCERIDKPKCNSWGGRFNNIRTDTMKPINCNTLNSDWCKIVKVSQKM